MASQILINIGSGNGLLPDGTESLFGPTLTYRIGIYSRAISWEILNKLIMEMFENFSFTNYSHKCLKMIYLKMQLLLSQWVTNDGKGVTSSLGFKLL